MKMIYVIAADGESIIKFIDSARQKLAARHDADPMPF